MRDFFRGWRRKAGVVGCITLVILAGFWIESFFGETRFTSIYFCEVEATVISKSGRLQIEIWQYGMQGAARTTYPLKEWRELWLGARYGSGVIVDKASLIRIDGYSLPYPIVFIPLTILSVVLLLWPQRKNHRGAENSKITSN